MQAGIRFPIFSNSLPPAAKRFLFLFSLYSVVSCIDTHTIYQHILRVAAAHIERKHARLARKRKRKFCEKQQLQQQQEREQAEQAELQAAPLQLPSPVQFEEEALSVCQCVCVGHRKSSKNNGAANNADEQQRQRTGGGELEKGRGVDNDIAHAGRVRQAGEG